MASVLAAGGGEGTYMPAIVLFPFAMLGPCLGVGAGWPVFFVAFLQFPIYGACLVAPTRASLRLLVLAIIVAAHLGLACYIAGVAGCVLSG